MGLLPPIGIRGYVPPEAAVLCRQLPLPLHCRVPPTPTRPASDSPHLCPAGFWCGSWHLHPRRVTPAPTPAPPCVRYTHAHVPIPGVRSALLLAAGDAVALLLFAAAGRSNHGEATQVADALGTALPFIIGEPGARRKGAGSRVGWRTGGLEVESSCAMFT